MSTPPSGPVAEPGPTPPSPGSTPPAPADRTRRLPSATPLLVLLAAFTCAVVIGGIVMLLTGADPVEAYWALLRGAVGTPQRIAASLARATPFIGASLALAFAFRAGLFNIGAEGQLLIGALFAGWAGTWSWMEGVPAIVAIPVVLAMGALGGALYGGIPGALKAKTGAHEVIVTIMLNTIALRLLEWLVLSRDPVILLDTTASVPHSRQIVSSAVLPLLPGAGSVNLHWGLLLGVTLCAVMWFVMERTTTGFEIKAVGLNPSAATYAGMSVSRVWVLAMAGSGAFAGLAGAAEVSGAVGFIQPGVFRNIGFDSIAIALLARANPWAIIPAALLWGALLSGAPLMQLEADLSIDLVRIVQALILLFVAADLIVRRLFRIRGGDAEPRAALASGWGGLIVTTLTEEVPVTAVGAEAVTPRRTRFVVIGWVYAVLGVGLLELSPRIPSEDVTFTFGVPPLVPQVTLDPMGMVLAIGLLLVIGGITGILERRLGQVARVGLGVATAALIPLVLVLALAYSTSSKQTNLVPLLVESLRLGTPIALGALAGLWCERAGVVNIGIEGMMLAAAGGGIVSYALLGEGAGGAWLYGSVVVAVAVGGLMAALHAVLTVTFRTDQIISGVVINLLALGTTSYLRQQVIVPSGAGRGVTLPEIALPLLSDIPIVGPVFVGKPIYLTMFVLLIGTTLVLFRTRFGLRVRSVGENPHAAETVGIDVIKVKYMAVILGGLIAGLAGAWFSLETVGSFEDNMTNGAGFIALAALIFGKWRPWQAFGGALLFGFSGALGVRMQILSVRLEDFRFLFIPVPDLEIPSQFLQSLPFVVTIIVLAGAIGRAIAPAAVGQPFEPSK